MKKTLIWIPPWLLTPPHAVARHDQVIELANQFAAHGWDPEKPALIGYILPKPEHLGRTGCEIQLLSGTHRHAASLLAIMHQIPVCMVPYAEVERAWGDIDLWRELMTAPPAGTQEEPKY